RSKPMSRVRAPPALSASSLPPLGVARDEAAAFVGVSVSKFDQMVNDGRMPPPKRIDGRKVWDVRRLTAAFDDLPDDDAPNPWDAD
ncbi:MAG TPA: hypothetical protein PKZ99_02345, partial [Azospirillaceae bacterium]|nr:hypothetical protein [Azospirillaceae bacterium]